MEAVGWVMARVFDVGGALRGRPRFTEVGAETRIHVGDVGSSGRGARYSWIEYQSTSVGKSPVMSAS